jgi:hypothetical protein
LHEDEKCPNETRSTITSTTGGVMTGEVGAVTGELEVATRPRSGTIEVVVRYVGADEWYAVDGSPIAVNNADELSYSELHEHVVRYLTRPGVVVKGNEEPASLRGFSP